MAAPFLRKGPGKMLRMDSRSSHMVPLAVLCVNQTGDLVPESHKLHQWCSFPCARGFSASTIVQYSVIKEGPAFFLYQDRSSIELIGPVSSADQQGTPLNRMFAIIRLVRLLYVFGKTIPVYERMRQRISYASCKVYRKNDPKRWGPLNEI